MKINDIIRRQRLLKKLTQEQLASCLGVSTPAVNKWEKGSSYPDITLLPALARMLDTDLNTLLSFQEDLSREEIGTFINQIVLDAQENGIHHAFEILLNKLHEYPSSDLLLLNAAITLDGLVEMDKKTDTSDIQKEIAQLYQRCANSNDLGIKHQALYMIILKHMQKEEFEQAQEQLDCLPVEPYFDKSMTQAHLYMKQKKLQNASQLLENRLLKETDTISSILQDLISIAEKENRNQDADNIAAIYRQFSSLFKLWDYHSYMADFQLAQIRKDAKACIDLLIQMISAMQQEWKVSNSVLYQHINKKKDNNRMAEMILPVMLNDLENPELHEYDFIKEHGDYQKLMQAFKAAMNKNTGT